MSQENNDIKQKNYLLPHPPQLGLNITNSTNAPNNKGLLKTSQNKNKYNLKISTNISTDASILSPSANNITLRSKPDDANEETHSGRNPRYSTGPVDADEVHRQLENQELDDEQRTKLTNFVNAKQKIGDLCSEDFKKLAELGQGNGGVVRKVRHISSGLIMAKKIIHLEIKPALHAQIIRELKVLHDCNSPYIVGYYGAFLADGDINLCMEFMDGGSLDILLKYTGRIPEPIISIILYSVLKGLLYLHDNHRIIHRDVKPSNILVNRHGEVKLCDFGVSGQLIDSLVNSFVGTRSYMAPERLSGENYSTLSDVWSLGLSLIELATGRYPIPPMEENDLFIDDAFSRDRDDNLNEHLEVARNGKHLKPVRSDKNKVLGIFELLSYIVDNPPPILPKTGYSEEFIDFVKSCLAHTPKERLNLSELLTHQFVRTVGCLYPEGVERRGSICLLSTSPVIPTDDLNRLSLQSGNDLTTLFSDYLANILPNRGEDSTDPL